MLYGMMFYFAACLLVVVSVKTDSWVLLEEGRQGAIKHPRLLKRYTKSRHRK